MAAMNSQSRGNSYRSTAHTSIHLEDLSGGQLKQVFDQCDVNHDGRLSLSEFKRLFSDRAFPDIPDEVAKKLLQLADDDENGTLDFDEFQNLVRRPEFRSFIRHALNQYVSNTIPRRGRRRLGVDTVDTIEYEEKYSCSPPAVCMLIVSLVEIAAFLADVITIGSTEASGPAATVLMFNPFRRYEAWRFVTYMFVHVGITHLVVNLLVQIMLGIPLEMVHHWWRVLIIYLSGVVAGSLGTSISDPYVYLAGASGGVYAIITAHLATIIMNWSEMRFAILQLLVFLLLVGVDLGSAIYNRYVIKVDTQIGYAAHLAGAIAGLLVGINVLKNLQVQPWEKKVWWASIVLFGILMLGAIIWNIAAPAPEFFPVQQYN